MIARICEEFACTPLEALAQPLTLTLAIMDLRGYARAKEYVESAPLADLRVSPMTTLVMEIMATAWQRRLLKAKAQANGNR